MYDALTDLFLGDGCLAPVQGTPRAPRQTPSHEPPERAGLMIEALVLGHLPVLASAWVGQYARHVAQTGGQPVALLRVRAGSVALDLIGGEAGVGSSMREPLTSLDEAVREGAAHTGRWVLSVEATSEPRVAAMLGSGGIDTLTLLTGADEAAVVACYRTIKSLVGKAPEAGDPEGPGPANIRLGIMGAPQDRATEAGQTLSRAAETFLGQTPKVVACVGKISGAAGRALYRGSDERSVEEIVSMVRGMTAPIRTAPAVARREPSFPVRTAPVQPLMAPASQSSHHVPTVGRIGMPAPEPALPGAPTRGGGLTAHLPGLTPVAFCCPYATGVELAKSPEGRLHLLARPESGQGLGSAPARLAGAAAWARAHADLLMAACPGLSMKGETSTAVSHIFAEHAPAARCLLDAEIRVHLLTEVRMDGQTALVCVDLN